MVTSIASQAGPQISHMQHGNGQLGPRVQRHQGISGVSRSDTEGMSVMGRIKSNVGIRELPNTPPTLMKGLEGYRYN